MQKYQEDFARLRNSSVSQGLRNSFWLAKVSQGVAKFISFARLAKFLLACENFAKGCEIDFPQLWFRKACEIPSSLWEFRKGLRNSFSVSQGLRNFILSFARLGNSFFPALLSVLQLVFLLGSSQGVAKLLNVRFLLWFTLRREWCDEFATDELNPTKKVKLTVKEELGVGEFYLS